MVDERILWSLSLAESGSLTVRDYVRFHAQEMAPLVIQQHIDLYVNRFSRNLGEEGRKAVEALLDHAEGAGLLRSCALPLMAY